jgi:pSer/pThr/pTyr-binding forkhead associated (FHA) protein
MLRACWPPRSSIEIADGDTINLADYSLVFQGGAQTSQVIQARVETTSARIDIDSRWRVRLSSRTLATRPASNSWWKSRVGDPKLLQIEPGPVLFPDVEKRCGFRLLHPKQSLPVAVSKRSHSL